MTSKLNWGILATGGIAHAFARGILTSKNGHPYAVASRDVAKAQKFFAEFGFEKSYGSYDELLNDPKVRAAYLGE